jgi:hypothetical protein
MTLIEDTDFFGNPTSYLSPEETSQELRDTSDASTRGEYFWDTSGGRLDVEMTFGLGTGDESHLVLQVFVGFLTDILRCTYEIQPWVGYYRQPIEATGGVLGAFSVEDHFIYDITWRRAEDEFAHREMHYAFARGLPWLVEVLGGESNNNSANIDPEVEYFNDFYINVLDFPYMAYDSGASFPNQLRYYDKPRSYTFDYSDLWTEGYIDEIFVNSQTEHKDFVDADEEGRARINVSHVALGVVEISFDPSTLVSQRYLGKLQVEERLINKTMFINVKPSHGDRPTIFERAGKLRACHSRFTGE